MDTNNFLIRTKAYFIKLMARAAKSSTMWVALFWMLVQTLAENITLFSAVVADKHYPFVVVATIALSRMRGLMADIKKAGGSK